MKGEYDMYVYDVKTKEEVKAMMLEDFLDLETAIKADPSAFPLEVKQMATQQRSYLNQYGYSNVRK